MTSYQRAVTGDRRYIDCDVMKREFLWSDLACQRASPLNRQLQDHESAVDQTRRN
jgi:hypothetical protein